MPTGMLSGAMGQFLASPTDLIKIRLQMEGKRALDGLKPRLVGDQYRLLLSVLAYSTQQLNESQNFLCGQLLLWSTVREVTNLATDTSKLVE